MDIVPTNVKCVNLSVSQSIVSSLEMSSYCYSQEVRSEREKDETVRVSDSFL